MAPQCSMKWYYTQRGGRWRRTLYEPGVHVGRRDAGADALHACTIRPGLAGQLPLVPLAGAVGAAAAATAAAAASAIGRTALASSSAQSSIEWSAFAQGKEVTRASRRDRAQRSTTRERGVPHVFFFTALGSSQSGSPETE